MQNTIFLSFNIRNIDKRILIQMFDAPINVLIYVLNGKVRHYMVKIKYFDNFPMSLTNVKENHIHVLAYKHENSF